MSEETAFNSMFKDSKYDRVWDWSGLSIVSDFQVLGTRGVSRPKLQRNFNMLLI
jgi:hypothetical protein